MGRNQAATEKLAGAEGFEPPSSVLETDSLTIELTPLHTDRLLRTVYSIPVRFFMSRMLAATITELRKLQPAVVVFLFFVFE